MHNIPDDVARGAVRAPWIEPPYSVCVHCGGETFHRSRVDLEFGEILACDDCGEEHYDEVIE
jgi:predicted RNA-binding Zn-ribbon protein involved in translation (DUF1610 family)